MIGDCFFFQTFIYGLMLSSYLLLLMGIRRNPELNCCAFIGINFDAWKCSVISYNRGELAEAGIDVGWEITAIFGAPTQLFLIDWVRCARAVNNLIFLVPFPWFGFDMDYIFWTTISIVDCWGS